MFPAFPLTEAPGGVTWTQRALPQPCAVTRLGLPGGGAARGRGGAEAAGGGGAAQGRAERGGAPGVLWDAAVEWRWARDFEQTRVCVSEAPPPPRLLGAPGARREEEAAAPPARVSVSSGDPGWAAGTGAGPAGRSHGRRAPAGSWAAGPVGRGGLRVGGARPRAAGARERCCHSVGSAPPARRSGARARRLLTGSRRGPGSRRRPRDSGNRFCCCVISYQRLLSLLPAAAFFLRPFVWTPLGVCPFPSRSPPAKCHNVPAVHGGRERTGAQPGQATVNNPAVGGGIKLKDEEAGNPLRAQPLAGCI